MNDREVLEQAALEAVSALNYYELADYMDVTTDEELIAIIEGREQELAIANGEEPDIED